MTDQLETPPQPTIITPAQAALEAIAHAREMALFTKTAVDQLLEISTLQQTPPEMHTIVINDANSGVYTVTHRSRFECKSIGIFNPGAAPVFVGVGGISATPTSRAPSCPGAGVLVLPVVARSIELGCDPAVLLGATAVVYLFQFLTVQPLMVSIA